MIRPPGNGARLNSRTPIALFSTLQHLSADTAVTAPNGGDARALCHVGSHAM